MVKPLIISHRTEMGFHPENSLEGIDGALRNGADAIEFDVRVTADGIPVLVHDETIKELVGEPRISDITYEYLQNLADESASHICPSLETALDLIPLNCVPIVEIKVQHELANILQVLESSKHRDNAKIWCFYPRVVEELRSVSPVLDIALNFSANSGQALNGPATLLDGLDFALRHDIEGISVSVDLLERPGTRTDIEKIHSHGKQIFTWTVNKEEQIELAIQLGVDGICGDSSLEIKRIVEKVCLLNTCLPVNSALESTGFIACRPGMGLRGVAQLVEHRSPKPRVAGSNPVSPAKHLSGRLYHSTINTDKNRYVQEPQLFLSNTFIMSTLPGWRNWQTRCLEGAVPFGCMSSNLIPGTTVTFILS